MIHWRRISANWNNKEVIYLRDKGINIEQGYSSFDIIEDENYFSLLTYIQVAKEFSDRRVRAQFSEKEINDSQSYLLIGGVSNRGYAMSTDFYEVIKEVYDGYCDECDLPIEPQIRPFVFRNKPNPGKRNVIFSAIGASGMIFTRKETYAKFFMQWNLGTRDVLFGKSRKVLDNIVQLVIPTSKSALVFGSSDYSKRFDSSGEIGDFDLCSKCGRARHTNQLLDFFPTFSEEIDEDIIYTKEWFGDRKHLVISKRFAKFLEEIKIIKINTHYLIPVSSFV